MSGRKLFFSRYTAVTLPQIVLILEKKIAKYRPDMELRTTIFGKSRALPSPGNASHDDDTFFITKFLFIYSFEKNFDDDLYGDGYGPPLPGGDSNCYFSLADFPPRQRVLFYCWHNSNVLVFTNRKGFL